MRKVASKCLLCVTFSWLLSRWEICEESIAYGNHEPYINICGCRETYAAQSKVELKNEIIQLQMTRSTRNGNVHVLKMSASPTVDHCRQPNFKNGPFQFLTDFLYQTLRSSIVIDCHINHCINERINENRKPLVRDKQRSAISEKD